MRFRPANISLINRRHYLPRLLLILSSKKQMQKPPQRFEDVDRVTPYQGRVADQLDHETMPVADDATGRARADNGNRRLMTSHIQTRGHWRQYWKSVPLASMVALGVAVFLTFSSLVFVSDLVEPRPSPYWWVLVYAADMGIVATGYALASTRFIRLLPLAVAVHLLTIFGLTRVLPLYSRKVASGTTVVELHGRHILDAWLVVGLVTLGYAVFFNFISTEGKNYVRLRTEIELAERVQARLVPAFEMTAARLAICGKSVPSSSVGGDLVDAVAFDGAVTCYLADVSGHAASRRAF